MGGNGQTCARSQRGESLYSRKKQQHARMATVSIWDLFGGLEILVGTFFVNFFVVMVDGYQLADENWQTDRQLISISLCRWETGRQWIIRQLSIKPNLTTLPRRTSLQKEDLWAAEKCQLSWIVPVLLSVNSYTGWELTHSSRVLWWQSPLSKSPWFYSL